MSSVIFHLDVNSAYLSWTAITRLEQGETLDLRLVPAVIGGDQSKRHGVVLAKSLPAARYGIRTGEPIANALRKCPGLVIAPPDHKMYSARSRQMIQYLSGLFPVLEQVSIDECYLDYSSVSHLYPSYMAAAQQIKDRIRERFQFTVNIGISDRKVLAKMASDFQKPDRIHTLFSHEIQAKMWPLDVGKLYMCGRSSRDILRKLEILTIGDLAMADPTILTAHLKSHGLLLHQYANGIDPSLVDPQPSAAKGIGNSTTLSQDATSREDTEPVLLWLAESVSRRLQKSGQLASQISCEIKYSTFTSFSHQTTLEVPTDSTKTIYDTACHLFDELWDGSPVRLLGIRTTRLTTSDQPSQLSLFDLLKK